MIVNERMRSALPVLERLSGPYEAVFVGGCVRDVLLGADVTDVDIATSALPEQVMALFARTLPTGLQHGTVTVLTDQGQFEVTTYRKEAAYEGFRRPGSVEFIPSLTEDLRRRDFTINAIAMYKDGTIVDPFGGQQDLEKRLIRCVGDPDARLQEDALRILRGVRFAARLGARIESATWAAMLRHRGLLRHVAMERVGVELDKMIGGPDPAAACSMLADSGLLACTREALAVNGRMEGADWTGLGQVAGTDARWAALCILCGLAGEASVQMLRTLRFAAKRADSVGQAVDFHCKIMQASAEMAEQTRDAAREAWIRAVLAAGRETAAMWLAVLQGDMLDNVAADELLAPYSSLSQWLTELQPATLQQLALGGHELQRLLNRSPGPWIRTLLQQLLVDAALGKVDNTKEALAERAAMLYTKEQP
ncbi:CCA tRNA nucleotidyltransferase [Paenibacillus sp. 1P07SE]|uniref:CCA tRNA nucleotidyltransferase n=1 Tax=Paenibacillus sp. 1P07SE TaxID=3132209 RepID=UPI0039A42B07